MATYQWPGYEPFFLARALGYFGEREVQLLEFPSAADCILAFKNRVVDAATLTADEAIRLAHTGHEPRMVMLIDFSNGTDVIVAKPEIATLAAVKGRVVGVENNTLGSFFLARALETAGLTSADIKTVNCRADQIDREYAQGRLDAAVTYDPYRRHMLAAGARQIFDSSKLPGEIIDTLVVRRSVAENPPAGLRKLIEAWFQANDAVKADPGGTAERMAPREGVGRAELLESLQGIQLLGRSENQKLLVAADSPLPARLQRLADFLAKSGLLSAAVDTKALLHGKIVEAIAP
jgi:NitT/TauT family transport system substrate-binding protein